MGYALARDTELLKYAFESIIRAAHPSYVQDELLREKLIKARDIAFKALETNRLNAKERHRTADNHTLDVGNTIAQRQEPNDELIAEIKAMASIRLIDGRVELSNVKEIIHAIVHHPLYAK